MEKDEVSKSITPGEFKLMLKQAPMKVRVEYGKLLLAEQTRNKQEKVVIGPEEREHLFRLAESSVRAGVSSADMEIKFSKAGFPTRGSQPPSDFIPDEEDPA